MRRFRGNARGIERAAWEDDVERDRIGQRRGLACAVVAPRGYEAFAAIRTAPQIWRATVRSGRIERKRRSRSAFRARPRTFSTSYGYGA